MYTKQWINIFLILGVQENVMGASIVVKDTAKVTKGKLQQG